MSAIDFRAAVRGLLGLLAALPLPLLGQSVEPPRIDLSVTNNQKVIQLPIEPSVEKLEVLQSPNLETPFTPSSKPVLGFKWSEAIEGPIGFYQTRKENVSSNELLMSIVLNRIAYGPTPDDIDHVRAIGADKYIEEQLEPEKITQVLDIDQPAKGDEWRLVTATGMILSDFTGVALLDPILFIYSTGVGDCHIDDIQLVKGFVPGIGENFIKDGGFEDDSAGLNSISSHWLIGTNMTLSGRATVGSQSGLGSLHLVYSSEGDQLFPRLKSVSQPVSGLNVGDFVTLSYWLKPGTNNVTGLVVRMSGFSPYTEPDTLATKVYHGGAILDDFRAWHSMQAVRSKKQLLETLVQFWDNHFTTQVTKSRGFFSFHYGLGSYGADNKSMAAEFNELSRWKAGLLRPETTFEDMLRISAESPAMIIYLDTVNSRGVGNAVANENYARELLELFTFGVDNGYDQHDVTEMSRVWTGWTLEIVDRTNEFNPLAPRSTTLLPGAADPAKLGGLDGVWAFNFNSSWHNVLDKKLFAGKKVPDRFGPPYAGREYELTISGKSGTNGIAEGYEVLAHLANQPFTQEFISVKLCRLFVHDDFQIGYDFTDSNLSEEGALVRQCMDAWENSIPKGKIRDVVRVILNSDLFRGNGAARNKVKTPFEFAASAVRALHTDNNDGIATAGTDGYSFKLPLERMGDMRLFDRESPDGWPENGEAWISGGALAERIRFVQALMMDASKDFNLRMDAGASSANPVALLKKRVGADRWNNADAVADFFVGILFPGEGRAAMAEYHAMAVDFLNKSDNGLAASPFAGLDKNGAVYDTRVRGVVAMLMTTERFQEQ